MKTPVFSIRFLLAITAIAALGVASLARPSFLLSSTLFSFTLLAMTAAVAITCCTEGKHRAFWLGASILGWTYLTLSISPWFAPNIGSGLITTYLLTLIAHAIGEPYIEPANYGANGLWSQFLVRQTNPGFLWDDILISGHSLFSLFFAITGGLVGRFAYAAGGNCKADA